MNSPSFKSHLQGSLDELGERQWFDRTINKGMTRLVKKNVVSSACPYPKYTSDPNIFKEESSDPLVKINEKFREIYSKTKKVTLENVVRKCVIVSDSSSLVFFVNGIRSEPVSIVSQDFLDLKSVAHIPFSLYLILDPFSHERTNVFPSEELKEFKQLFHDVYQIIGPRFRWTKYFGKDLLPIQENIMNITLEFFNYVMNKQGVTRPELVEFCRKQQPFIKENIKAAAIAQVNELHTKVMEFSESISHDQWENVHVVIMGSHMARKGFLISQYFAKLFGIREDDDRKLIFAEGNFEEGFALDLLATNRTDTEASEAFFSDPEYMHSDILSRPTEEYLEVIFNESTNIYVAVAQILIIPYDQVGNHRRLRSAAKKAASAGVDLICFPEAVVSGGNKDSKLAELIPAGPTYNHLVQLAQTYKIWICAGIYENVDNKLYNSVVLINKLGQLALHHREGETPKAVYTPFGNIVGVCYKDMTFHQEIRQLEPSLTIVPFGIVVDEVSKWPVPQSYSIPLLAQSYAKLVASCVVATNSVSESLYKQWSENIEYGTSVAVNGLGEILKQTTPCKEHIKFVHMKLNSHKRSSSEKWKKIKAS